MCGRAAQTDGVVNIAASMFSNDREALAIPSAASVCDAPGDNFNLSPGMDCDVILVDENGDFQVDRKKWGLITKNGTVKKPLYTDGSDLIKLCFESLCFNARSETLYSKPTFSKLVHGGRTCIIALDGYFEWKSHPIPKMNKSKQPYFVYRRNQLDHQAEQQQVKREPLLVAGIWTRVTTGVSDAPELGCFAMLTTDASEEIKWLHHRMPVCIWSIDLAKKWLTDPSESLKKEIDDRARCKSKGFRWHKVTPEMSKISYRSKEAIQEIKETTQSIKHFFASGGSLVKKSEREDTERLLWSNVNIGEDNKNVNKFSFAKSTVTSSTATSKDSTPTTTKDGKRQSSMASEYISPKKKQNCTKNKFSRSTALDSNKQTSICSFFGKATK